MDWSLSADETFQVLRLPWMVEVLEPPGAAPVKTWKVCRLNYCPHRAGSDFRKSIRSLLTLLTYILIPLYSVFVVLFVDYAFFIDMPNIGL